MNIIVLKDFHLFGVWMMVMESAIYHITQKSLTGVHNLVLVCGGSSLVLIIFDNQ